MERIEVHYAKVGEIVGIPYYHKYLLYYPDHGTPQYARGGPDLGFNDPGGFSLERVGQLETRHGDYNASSPDYDAAKVDRVEVLKTGGDLSREWHTITFNMDRIEAADIEYHALSGPNSNSAVDASLAGTDVPPPQYDNFLWSPGSDLPLPIYAPDPPSMMIA